jgi:PhnB protein
MLLPTFHLPGNCNEAIAFYQKAVGAEIKNIAYAKDAPADEVEGVPPNFVIHSEILILGTQIGLTDMGEKQLTDEQFMFTVLLDSDEEVTAVFNKLADGGKIIEPLAPQFWTSLNGSIEDPFGISWNIGTRTK